MPTGIPALSDLATQLDAAYVGHPGVEDHQVWALLFDDTQHLSRIAAGGDLVALPFQARAHHEEVIHLVVYNQDVPRVGTWIHANPVRVITGRDSSAPGLFLGGSFSGHREESLRTQVSQPACGSSTPGTALPWHN